MRALNFWKTLFCAAWLATAFTACSDDDDKNGYSGIPEITVNGADKTVVAAKLEGGTTAAIEVVTKGSWTLGFKNAADATWCTPSQLSGQTGTTQLTFKVAAATEPREAIATLSVRGEVAGIEITKAATITVKQNASGSFVLIYKETLGTTEPVDNPLIKDYDGWEKSGTGAANVTYTGDKTSIRKSGLGNTGAYDGASGPNVVFFGAAPATFTIQDITLTAEQTSLQLTFGGSYSYKPEGGDYDNNFDPASFKISLSANGDTFVPITYSINDGDEKSPYWVLATADFTLSKAASKLYIRFEALSSSAYRLDDITLQTGSGGQSVDLDTAPPMAETVTIGQITGAGNYKVENATVIVSSEIAYLIADNTGQILVYGNNTRQVGEKINISGPVTIFNASSVPQFDSNNAVTELISTGNPWSYDYADYTATEIEAYLNDIQCIAVQIKGTVVQDGRFYNLVLNPEVSNLQGSIQYYTPTAEQLDKPVIVKGYAVGTSESGGVKRIKIFPTQIVEDATMPYISITAPEQFSAEGQTIDVAFSSGGLAANKVFARIEGANAAQFSAPAGEITGRTVAITALANAELAPKSAKLVLYAAASEGGAVVATDEVVLSQEGKPIPGAMVATFDYTTITTVDTTVDAVSITCNANSGSNPVYNAGSQELRIYRYNSFSFATTAGTILKIEFTFSSSSYMGYQLWSDVGQYAGSSNDHSGLWIGDAASVKFTNNGDSSNNIQARLKKIVVTYK